MAWQSFGTQHRGTKRTMGLLYIVFSLLLNDDVHSAFEVKKVLTPFSWEIALHHCNTIRRNLTFAVPVVDLRSMTVLDKIDLQGEAWVGYFQTYEFFLFIACVPLSAIESSASVRFNMWNRPGACYSFCGLQGYIGLEAGRCYCIETRTFSTPEIHSVNSSCENPLHCGNGMLCGNLGYIKISVYKKVFISSNDIRDGDSGCLIVTKRKEYMMSVANCTSSFKHLCESYTGQTLNLEESPTNNRWAFSIRDCAKTDKKSTTFIGNGTNFVFPNSSRSWWTSVVRDLVIRNCSESMTIKGTPVYEGFLKKSTEGIKLEFVPAGKYSRKAFVACMSEQLIIEQENRTNAPSGTTITSAPSEALTMSLIPDVPGVPSNVTVIDLTQNRLTIQWVAGYNGGPEQTFHIIASVGEFTRSVTLPDPGCGKKGIAALESLLPGTRYSIYMTAVNAIGSSNKTETIIIVTPEEASTHESLGIPVPGIAGGTVAGFFAILCLVIGIFLWRRHQHAKQNEHDIPLEENRNAHIRPPENDSYEKLHPYTNSDIQMYSSLTNPETSKDSDQNYENTCLG